MTEQDASAADAAADAEDVDLEDAPDDVDADAIDLDDVTGAEDAPDDELVERVAESDPEDIARELAALRTRTDALESEVADLKAEADELEDKLKRKQAEFQNYKKRMDKRREEEKQRATEDLVTRVLDVRDNLERALDQDEDAEIRSGVESTLRQLDDVLAAENVEVIDPDPGEDVDPTQHQVLANVESDEDPGAIADVHRPGYEMAEKVLREAQVTVSEE
ncbi:nucleotide exchange factor GrpE [Haloarcula marina]|uniref:nucleotide exchange factor GrpE n=1 Tax=Haloarcula marina TaxID=2961574 RepID=UPI0020B74723|nr:nucleotide exchange factor GrpE [Halomicroarcula marina]